MAIKKIGAQTVRFQNPPSIISTGTVVGPKEGEGPLRSYFDMILEDDLWGEETWEKCESKMQQEAIKIAINKGNLSQKDIEYMFGGDLLNQIISSGFAARQMGIPFFGLYGACSTMTESLSLGAMTIDGGYADKLVCVTSSHFSTAERQFRFPLELGNQRNLTAQWTATASGAAILSSTGIGPFITHVTTGKISDPGIVDTSNMGAAMAPAAVDTIAAHFQDTGFSIDNYDLIITGDLGYVGKEIALDLLKKEGLDIENIYSDCGIEIFYQEKQDVHAGASGCGCSAVVFGGYLYNELINGKYNKILLVSTGALHSSTSALQGESIPGIAHAVTISRDI